MPAAHFHPVDRSGGSGSVRNPPAPEPFGTAELVLLVAFWGVLIGGSVVGAVSGNFSVSVGAWLLFYALVLVVGIVDRGRPDAAREARQTADDVVAGLRASGVADRVESPDQPADPDEPVSPDRPAEDEPVALVDIGALVAVKVEERMTSLLVAMERRGRRSQWRFFLLGVPVGLLVNWASARLWDQSSG